MEQLTISEIIEATGGELLSGNTDLTVDSVYIDSRKCEKNSLFIPLIGNNNDGHEFIEKAFESGALVSLVQKNHKILENPQGSLIAVESTQKALGDLAKYYRHKFKIPFIGVTGSVGKTTTKEMIAAALSSSMNVLKTESNYNGQIGLPLTLFNLNSTHQVAVVEMGISEFGEMDRLSEIADVDIAVITNIGVSHIENFKSTQNTCREKIKILPKNKGILYLNGDSPILSDPEIKLLHNNIIYFGMNGNYPYKCEDIYSDDNKTHFTLITSEFKEPITIPCLGIHNVYNALAAISIADGMGIHIEDIKKGLMAFKNVEMRQQIFNLNGVTIIDDSYNASPDSIKSSVGVLRTLPKLEKNIVVIADMLELGEKSHEIHFETGRYIAIEGIDIIVTIGNESKYLSDGAKSSNQYINAVHFDSNAEACEFLSECICKGDNILIKGSRGMHTEEIVNFLKDTIKKPTRDNKNEQSESHPN